MEDQGHKFIPKKEIRRKNGSPGGLVAIPSNNSIQVSRDESIFHSAASFDRKGLRDRKDENSDLISDSDFSTENSSVSFDDSTTSDTIFSSDIEVDSTLIGISDESTYSSQETESTDFTESESASVETTDPAKYYSEPKKGFNFVEFFKNCWNWICFFLLGYINNVPYSVGISSSQSLSVYFKQERLYGFIIWANIFLGAITQALFILILRHVHRTFLFLTTSLCFIASLLGVIFCIVFFGEGSALGFWLTVCFVLVIGGSCSVGLSLIFSFLTIYEKKPTANRFVLSGIGAGTGMAGIGGSGFYVLFSFLGFGNIFQFGILVPLIIIFMFIPFICLVTPKDGDEQIIQEEKVDEEEKEEEETLNNKTENAKTPIEGKKLGVKDTIKDVFQGVWFVGINTFMTYFLGYLIQTGLGEKVFDYKESQNSKNAFVKNSYIIFAFLFRLGILLSRSTSMLFQSGKRFLIILTTLQTISVGIWLVLAKTRWLSNEYFIFPLFVMMFLCGINSGFEYVNAYYIIMKLEKFRTKKNKEIAIYVNMLMEDLGIVVCSFVTLALHNTILVPSVEAE